MTDRTPITIYIITFFLYTAHSILAPFYPDHAIKKGVSLTVVGMIFGASPIGAFLLSFVFGKKMMKIGRKRLMALGICMEATAVFTFGFIDFLNNTNLYIAISYISRVMMGIGMTGFGTASYAFVAAHYPNELMSKIATIELFAGLGLMAGPVFGAVIYSVGGYKSVFLTSGSLFFAMVPYLWKNIPADKPYEPPKTQISYFKLLKIKKLLLTFLVPTFTIAGVASIEPTLQPHLLKYGLSPQVAAACFIIGTFSYSMVMPIVNKFPTYWDRRVIINFGMLLATVCQFLLGPTPGFFPSRLWITILGLFIQGYGCAITLIPAMPEMLQAAAAEYPNSKDELSDRISGLLSASFALGNLIGPQVGGYLSDHYGFPRGATVIGTATFGYLMILLTFGGGFCAFRSCFGKRLEGNYLAPSETLSDTIGKPPGVDDTVIELQEVESVGNGDKIPYESVSTAENSEML